MTDAGDEAQIEAADREGTRRQLLPAVVELLALSLFLAASVGFAIITPRLGGPDEDGHLINAIAISRGAMPVPAASTAERVVDGQTVHESAQAHHPPLFYAIVAGANAVFGGDPALLTPIGRGLNVLAGLAALLLLRAAAHRIFPARRAAIAAGIAIAAGSATFTYIMGSFNNEPLAAMMICLSIYLAARALEAPHPRPWMLALGACLGAGLLVKLTAAVIVVPLAILTTLSVLRAPSDRRGQALVSGGAALALAALISAPWFIRNYLLFGTPTFNCAYRPLVHSMGELIFDEWLPAGILALFTLEELLAGTWWPEWLLRDYHTRLADAIFGEITHLSRPIPFLVIAIAPTLVAVFGWVRMLRRRAEDSIDSHEHAMLAVLILIPLVSVLGIVHQTLLVDAHIVRWPGRYAPGFIPPLGMAIGLGVAALLPRRLHGALAVIALVSAMHINASALSRVHSFYEAGAETRVNDTAQLSGQSAVVGGEMAVHAADLPQVRDHLHPVGEGADPCIGRVDPADWYLHHLEAESQRDEDQFRVEGPAFEALVREDRLDRLAGEHLEAALGVGDAGAEDAALHDREHLPRGLAHQRLALLKSRALGGARADGDIRARLNRRHQVLGVLDRC